MTLYLSFPYLLSVLCSSRLIFGRGSSSAVLTAVYNPAHSVDVTFRTPVMLKWNNTFCF